MTIANPRRLGGLLLAAAFAAGACSSAATPTPAPATPAPATAAPASTGTGSASPTCVAGNITASGSTALQPLVDKAAKAYAAACSGSTIAVQGGGSGTGLTQVLQGAVQIGDSDVFAAEKLQASDATQLVDHQVVVQGWVMVVNKSVTGVTNLTTDQAKQIWTGAITNWKGVGGPDQPIVLVLRPASSGTRATFKKIVLGGATEANGTALTEDSNGAVATAVGGTPGATSVVGFSYYQANKGDLVAVQLDGVDATLANLTSGSYKLQALGHMYTKGAADGLAKAFLDYMLSPDVQTNIAPSLFYAPIPAK